MGEGDPKGDNYELVKNLVDIGPVDLEKIISKKCEKQIYITTLLIHRKITFFLMHQNNMFFLWKIYFIIN